MSKKAPIVYVLHGKLSESGEWVAIQTSGRRMVEYRGPGARSRAISDGKALASWPTYHSLRVMRGTEEVWSWKRS